MTPPESAPPPPTLAQGTRRVLRYALPYWPHILAAAVAMILYAGAVNGRAFLIKPFLEEVILPAEGRRLDIQDLAEIGQGQLPAGLTAPADPGERERVQATARGALLHLLVIAFALVSLIPLAHFVRSYLSAYVVNRMILDLQGDLCARLLRLPLSFHTRQAKGDVLSRLHSDVTHAGNSFGLIFGDLVQEPLTLTVGLAVMLWLNWPLTLLLLLFVPLLTALIVRLGRSIRRRSLRRQEGVGLLLGAMFQMFSGIKVVKAFRRESHETRRFREAAREVFRRNMRVVATETLAASLTDFFNNAIYILFLGIGVLAIIHAALGLTFPVLIAFLGLAVSLYPSVKHLSRAYNRIADAMGGLQRVTEILDLPAEEGETAKPDLPAIHQRITFEGVHFAYPDGPAVLRGVDLELRRGETLALVGRTGSGKTTVCDLLLRFYDPTAGRIGIDGQDLTAFNRDSLLRRVAVVTQEPFLFDSTVADNIRYGRLEATDEQVEAAARAAHIHDVVAALPERYATRVGDRGTRLSGGERQRLTIARAILCDPELLILDEATASLDAESESLVQQALDNLRRGRTTLVVAHRFATILRADHIAVLDEGRVVARGTHAELSARDGLYQELCRRQILDTPPPDAP